MADENGEIDPTLFDRLILQVFEEQEERCGSLTYPLSTQRHALDFVKLINRKGFPYVLMCQAIEEKQEKFRSWRLGNGNTHIGVVMMKRINRTVQEAMMLPDAEADVDIDELIDEDDDEKDEETEIADDDLTTDDDYHPTTSSSGSPPPTERLDDEALVDDTAAAADKTDSDSMPCHCQTTSPDQPASDDDDLPKDETNEVTESQASVTESQSSEQQQQQPSIDTGDVTMSTDNTGELGIDSPEPTLTSDKLDTDDTDARGHEDLEEIIADQGETADKDYTNSLAENQQDACNDGNVLIPPSDTPEANQQVCQPTLSESIEPDDVIPSTSASASATVSTSSLSTSSQQTRHAEVESLLHQEPQPTAVDQQRDEENDVKHISENKDRTETEQNGHATANERNDLQVSNHSELEENSDHEPDSTIIRTDENQSTSMSEEQEQTDNDETAVRLEERSSSSANDAVTPQQDAEIGDEEMKVSEESKATEDAKVSEEVKVTYEASAKQLDLLSRLAMLREKAAVRKAQQGSTDGDSSETPSHEDRELPRLTDDQSDSSQQQQKDDTTHTLTITDANRSLDREASLETDKQTAIDAEKQYTEDTASPSRGTVMTEEKYQTGQDAVEAQSQMKSTDNSCQSAAEDTSLSSRDVLTTGTHSELGDVLIAEGLNVSLESKTIPSEPGITNTDTKDAANLNTELALSRHVSSSTDTDIRKQDEICSSFAATNELQPADTGPSSHVQASSDARDGAISDAAVVAELNVQPVPADSESDNASSLINTNQADTEKLTNSELRGTATADFYTQPVDNSSYQLESAKPPSDTAISELSNATVLSQNSRFTVRPTESGDEPINDFGDAAVNYDSDLDPEFAGSDALQLLSDIETLKSSSADGPGYLYIFADRPRRRFVIGASRSPAKRLRQATVFNPDMTLLVTVAVSRRRAGLRELRRRLESREDIAMCLPGSRDWFTGSDDVITELVTQVASTDVA